jgi:AcrR family transcriptional regulator
MRAAISLFAERGFNAIGIREIAAAAELRSSTLYYYFRNKDDLLVEIMLSTIRPLRDAGAKIVAEIDDPVRCIAALVESHVWAHASDRMAMLVVDTEVRALSGERLSKVMQLRDEYEGIWRAVVRNGAKQDLFEAPQPEVAARALLQMTTGVSHWFSVGGKLKLEQLCREYADWALGLLRAHAGKQAVRAADLKLPKPGHYLTL